MILPEGHREPHSHHHVGGAAILRGENSLKITPHLKEKHIIYSEFWYKEHMNHSSTARHRAISQNPFIAPQKTNRQNAHPVTKNTS